MFVPQALQEAAHAPLISTSLAHRPGLAAMHLQVSRSSVQSVAGRTEKQIHK